LVMVRLLMCSRSLDCRGPVLGTDTVRPPSKSEPTASDTGVAEWKVIVAWAALPRTGVGDREGGPGQGGVWWWCADADREQVAL